jgi:hypothetical protein
MGRAWRAIGCDRETAARQDDSPAIDLRYGGWGRCAPLDAGHFASANRAIECGTRLAYLARMSPTLAHVLVLTTGALAISAALTGKKSPIFVKVDGNGVAVSATIK